MKTVSTILRSAVPLLMIVLQPIWGGISGGQPRLLQTSVDSPRLSAEEVFQRLAPSVFVVEALGNDGSPLAFGSGVVVGPNQGVTNKHVADEGVLFRVKQGPRAWQATVTHLDSEHDLCLLNVHEFGAPAVSIRDSSTLAVGERVYAIGAPEGLELTLSEGLVSGLRSRGNFRVIQTTAPVSHGSSGGGLFDSQGKLVGITTFSFHEGQNLNFAIPTEWILALAAQQPTPPTKPPEFPAPPASARVWKSQTTGKEYLVWVENERLRAEWTNLPPEFAQEGAYIRTECRRVGTQWIGTSHCFLPFPCETSEKGKKVTKWCRLTTRIEFSRVEADRMTGRAEGFLRFDCDRCRILESVMKDFEWTPKEPSPIPTKK